MAGPTIAATVSANTAPFQAAMQNAGDAIQRLNTIASAGGQSVLGMSNNMQQLAAAINPVIGRLVALNAAFQEVQNNAAALGAEQTTALFSRIGTDADRAAGGIRGVHVATSGAIREFIVLGHEAISGNWTRMGPSLIVLAERVGGLSTLISGLGAASGVAAVAVGGIAVALGYVIYQAYETHKAISEITGHFNIMGQGIQYNKAYVNSWAEDFKNRFNESGASLREFAGYLDKLGPAASGSFRQMGDIFEGFKTIKNLGTADALKEFERQFGHTAESMGKGALQMGAIGPVMEGWIKELHDAGEETTAFGLVSDQLAEHVKIGTEVAETRAQLETYNVALAGTAEFASAAALSLSNLKEALPKGPLQVGEVGGALSPEEIAGQTAGRRRSKEVQERRDLQRDLQNIDIEETRLRKEMADRAQQRRGGADRDDSSIDTARDIANQRELAELQAARANILAKLPEVHGEGERERFRQQMQGFEAELKAAGDNKTEIAKIQQRKSEVEIAYHQAGTSEAMKAGNDQTNAERAAAEQQFKLYEESVKRRQQLSQQNIAYQIQQQQELLDKMAQPTREGDKPFKEMYPQQYEAAQEYMTELLAKQADQRRQIQETEVKERQSLAGQDIQTQIELQKGLVSQMEQPISTRGGQTEAELEPEKYKQAKDKLMTLEQQAADQQFKIFEDGVRRRQMVAQQDVQEQIRLQQELLEKMRTTTEPSGEPYILAHQNEYQSAVTHLSQLQIEAANKVYAEFAAKEREKIAEAGQDWSRIAQIYAEWAEVAKQHFQGVGAEWENLQREMVRKAQEAVKTIVAEQLSAAGGQEHVDRLFLDTFKTRMQEMVKAKQITSEQAYGFDIQYTAQLYSELAAQYQAVLDNSNATVQQKQEAYNKLIELEADYTKQVTDDQAKILAASEKTAKEMKDTLSKAFDGIGSAMENALEGSLTGQKNVLRTFLQSVMKDLIGTTGSILSGLAGKGLAKMLGVDTGEGGIKDTSIGNVLGTWLADALGFGSKKPDSMNKSQADLTAVMSRSADYTKALTTATEKLTQAITEAQKIKAPVGSTEGQTLADRKGQIGPGDEGGGGGGGGIPSQAVNRAASYLQNRFNLTPEQAGAAAKYMQVNESGLDPNNVNKQSGAYGIGQWLGSRKERLFAEYGTHPTFDQQLKFLGDELETGSEGGNTLERLRATKTEREAWNVWGAAFERPGERDLARARANFRPSGYTGPMKEEPKVATVPTPKPPEEPEKPKTEEKGPTGSTGPLGPAGSKGIEVAVGDSIAAGVGTAMRFQGKYEPRGGETPEIKRERDDPSYDAVAGRTTQQVLAEIRASKGRYEGQTVDLSSGISNDVAGNLPLKQAYANIRQQITELQGAGAQVNLMGVGMGLKDHDIVNAELRKIAEEKKTEFTGGIQNARGVHPSDYREFYEQQIAPLGPRAQHDATPVPVKVVDGGRADTHDKTTETTSTETTTQNQQTSATHSNTTALDATKNVLTEMGAKLTQLGQTIAQNMQAASAAGQAAQQQKASEDNNTNAVRQNTTSRQQGGGGGGGGGGTTSTTPGATTGPGEGGGANNFVSSVSSATSGLQQMANAASSVNPNLNYLSKALSLVTGAFSAVEKVFSFIGKIFGGGGGSGGGGIGSLFSSLFGGGAGESAPAASTGGGLFGGGGGLFSMFGSMFSGIGKVFTSILSGIGSLFMLEGGGVIPIPSMAGGGIAHNPGLGGGHFSAHHGAHHMRIPSAAGGMAVDSRGGQLAVLHPQEMVLPAHISNAVQRSANAMTNGGGNGGGGNTYNGGDSHFHIHSLDTRTGAAWLMKNRAHVAAAMNSAGRDFNPGTNYSLYDRGR